LIKQRAHSIFNARISYENVENGWEIATFVTNVTDTRVLNSGQTSSAFGTTEGVTNRPREWGVSVKKKF
jgi:iron complex outermembrane receptor protein